MDTEVVTEVDIMVVTEVATEATEATDMEEDTEDLLMPSPDSGMVDTVVDMEVTAMEDMEATAEADMEDTHTEDTVEVTTVKPFEVSPKVYTHATQIPQSQTQKLSIPYSNFEMRVLNCHDKS